jgi:hypothetical protein
MRTGSLASSGSGARSPTSPAREPHFPQDAAALPAGLAREYDGVFLPCEPWRLLIPFAVSTAMGTILWSAFLLPRKSGTVGLRSFLGVFWMSAPLAWLYGIPYERFLSPLAAFNANLWTLGIVTIWRVAWVTRVVSVLRGSRTLPTLFRVPSAPMSWCSSWPTRASARDRFHGRDAWFIARGGGRVHERRVDVVLALAFTILALAALVTASRMGERARRDTIRRTRSPAPCSRPRLDVRLAPADPARPGRSSTGAGRSSAT